MSRYSCESAKTSAGVLMRCSSAPQPRIPPAISATHSTALAMQAVETAVFILLYFLAPKYCDTMTLQPMLQPKAKAIKISVIS